MGIRSISPPPFMGGSEWEWLVGPILYKGSAHEMEDNPSFWEWGGEVGKSMHLPPMDTTCLVEHLINSI